MKKITTIITLLIFINCGSNKNLTNNYSKYSNEELNNKKTSLNLELNYELVNHYLEQIERDEKRHMALTKIDKGIISQYLKNKPETKKYYQNWRNASSKASAFESKYAPELRELSKKLKQGKIERQEYFRLNRESRARLRKEYPNEYTKLSSDHISSLKTMWKQTGRFMLEDYKKQEKLFPIYWIPENERENSRKTEKYKVIKQEILNINNEIKTRKSNK